MLNFSLPLAARNVATVFFKAIPLRIYSNISYSIFEGGADPSCGEAHLPPTLVFGNPIRLSPTKTQGPSLVASEKPDICGV